MFDFDLLPMSKLLAKNASLPLRHGPSPSGPYRVPAPPVQPQPDQAGGVQAVKVQGGGKGQGEVPAMHSRRYLFILYIYIFNKSFLRTVLKIS